MRKVSVLVLVMFVLAAGAALAQEAIDSFFDFEVNIGFPVHWSNGGINNKGQSLAFYKDMGIEAYDKTVTANTSIGIAATFNFTPKMGVIIDADIFYGAQLTGIGGIDDSNEGTDTAYHTALFGFNVYLGPQFYLYNKGNLRIPLSIGPHVYFFTDDTWSSNGFKVTEFQLGLALGLGVQFHFDSNLYIFSRTNVAFDFFRMTTVIPRSGTDKGKSFSNIGIGLSWLVKPSLGVGVKF